MKLASHRVMIGLGVLLLSALALSACGDDDGRADEGAAGSGGSRAGSAAAQAGEGPAAGGMQAVGGDGQAGATTEGPPAILLVERVFAPTSRSYYVSVLSEMPEGPVDRSKAREFGSADIEAYDGAFYLRSREDNTM